eukprot:1194854-Prorocentrum_minimum.AAC.2
MIRDGDNAGVGSDSKGLVIGIPGREERAAFRACARFSTGTRSSWSSTAARRTYNQSQEGKQYIFSVRTNHRRGGSIYSV